MGNLLLQRLILTKNQLHPDEPQNVTGKFESDGSISITFDPVAGAKTYLTHYGNANQSDPKQAVNMGCTESNTWNLSVENIPLLEDGDKIYIYVQAYNELAVGADEVEKARYLHDGDFLGSAWSDPIVLTK
ncbi:fibronectin type III domain-containing protein [Enterococcus hirae]